MTGDKEKRLASLYFDPVNSASFTGFKNLYNGVKQKQWNDITRADVKNFLHKTRVYTLHKPHKKGKNGPIFSWGINYLWEIGMCIQNGFHIIFKSLLFRFGRHSIY